MNKLATFCLLLNLIASQVGAKGVEHSMVLQPHSGGTLYVEAMLADMVSTKLLVDTGASMLTLNQKTFRQLRQHAELHYSHDLGFRNANGKIHKVKVYVLPSLTLGGTCEIRDIEVAVMAKGTNILGMNVLSQFAPISLSILPPKLELSNCDDSLLAKHPALP